MRTRGWVALLLLAPATLAAGSSSADGGSVAPPESPPVTEADLEAAASLPTLESYAVQHDPAIEAARQASIAARERVPQMRSYENPEVGYSPDTGRMPQTRAGPQEQAVNLSQRIPFPGKLRLRGRVAEEQAGASQEALDAMTQEVVRRVRVAYADYYLAFRSLDVIDTTTKLAREFVSIAEARYRVGASPQQDVIRAQEELSRIAAERVGAEADRQSALGGLNAVLDRAPRAPLGPPEELHAEPLPVPLADLTARALRARPELRAEDHLVEARRRSLTLAKMEYLPDFKVGGQYIQVEKGTNPGFEKDGEDIWMATVGLSIPIWIGRIQAGIDEARARVRSETAQRRSMANQVLDDLQRAYERTTAAARVEQIYRSTLIPQTRQRVDAARAGYQTGQVDFLSLIDSLESLENARLQRFRAVRDYQRSVANLERAVGGPLGPGGGP
jgi:cobalt-zinc-cadmium efflux system outer membrane protein